MHAHGHLFGWVARHWTTPACVGLEQLASLLPGNAEAQAAKLVREVAGIGDDGAN